MRPVNNPERTPLHHMFEKTTIKKNPGPDAYQYNDSFDGVGKYHHSKHKSSGSKAWNPPSSQRFYKSSIFIVILGTDVPGAGNYHPVNDMSDSGKYVLSKNKGAGKRKVDKEFREHFTDVPSKITKST